MVTFISWSLITSQLYAINAMNMAIPKAAYTIEANTYSKTTYQYDVNGKKIGMTISGADGITGNSQWQRDIFGNVYQKHLQIKDPASPVNSHLPYLGETFGHSELNQLTSICNQVGQCDAHRYYANGMQQSSQDIAGNVFHYLYAPDGKLDKEIIGSHTSPDYQLVNCYNLPASKTNPIPSECGDVQTQAPYSGELLAIKEYWKDETGKLSLSSRIDYSYAVDGKPLSLTYDKGLPQEKSLHWSYNEYEQLQSQTDALGHITYYEYDAYGRSLKTCLLPESQAQAISKQQNAGLYQAAHPLLQQSNCDDAQHYVVYDYIDQTDIKNNPDLSIHLGKLEQLSYSNGTLKHFTYNGWSQLSEVHHCRTQNEQSSLSSQPCNANHPQLIKSQYYTYNATTGNIVQIENQSTLDPSGNSNYTQQYTYNTLNQLIESNTIPKDGDTRKSQFVYDQRANLLTKTDTIGTATESTSYEYNNLNQLTQLTQPDHTTIPSCHSASSSIQQLQVRDLSIPHMDKFTLPKQYDTSQCIAYDPKSGNMLKDGLGNEFDYNVLNQMTQYQNKHKGISTTHQYYANGLRSSKQITTNNTQHHPIQYYYDHAKNPNIINEVQVDKDTQTEHHTHYLLAGNERALRLYNQPNKEAKANQLIYGHKDVLTQLNHKGEIDQTYNYADYGKNISLNKSKAIKTGIPDYSIKSNPFQHSGEYRDIESNLDYLRARFYHPQLQMFAARDSKALINRYHYTGGNPIMKVDPSGHFAFMAALVTFGLESLFNFAITGIVDLSTNKSWKQFGKDFAIGEGISILPAAYAGYKVGQISKMAEEISNMMQDIPAQTEANRNYFRLMRRGITRQNIRNMRGIAGQVADNPGIVDQAGRVMSQLNANTEVMDQASDIMRQLNDNTEVIDQAAGVMRQLNDNTDVIDQAASVMRQLNANTNVIDQAAGVMRQLNDNTEVLSEAGGVMSQVNNNPMLMQYANVGLRQLNNNPQIMSGLNSALTTFDYYRRMYTGVAYLDPSFLESIRQ